MRLFYRNDRFELLSDFREKDRIKQSGGWRWDKKKRVWWARDIGTAAAFGQHATGEASEMLAGTAPSGRMRADDIRAALTARCFRPIGAGIRQEGPTPCGMVAWRRGARFTFDGPVVVPRETRDESILEAAERDLYRWLGFERLEDYAAEMGPGMFGRVRY